MMKTNGSLFPARATVFLVTASLLVSTAWGQDSKKKQPKKPRRPSAAGPAIGDNTATPIDRIHVAKGFQVELLYSVPGDVQGSWVNLCVDNKQRILVSDQFGGLYRLTPPAPGTALEQGEIEKVPAPIRAVNGMLWADGALYVGVNDYEKKIPSGFYRLTDSDGDDQLDKVELLREMEARGDHGIHAVLSTPDGKGFYLVCGNASQLTKMTDDSPVPRVWGEDHLLPRLPDGRGFMRDANGPGGIIYRVSRDGGEFSAVACGFRNIFDAALNREGELFTYDADMEYDFNTSWYRPTRICHVVSGAEYGWRNGAGKRPAFYSDNLPPVLDIGPGSPTGMTFGYGARFPAKYQNALYALDWSWGKLYAIHLEPQGATYTATKEEFLTGAPLPITDAIIHPQDGAMYFTIGGRRVQSGLYRVTYVGDASTAPAETPVAVTEGQKRRRELESFHGRADAAAVDAVWRDLKSEDRFLRWAARTALEHQPLSSWATKALQEPDPAIQVEAVLGLARAAGVCPSHRGADFEGVDEAQRDRLLACLLRLPVESLNSQRQQTYVRALEIVLHRFGRPSQDVVRRLTEKLDSLFPAPQYELNWLLCETMVYLQAPSAAAKGLQLIRQAPAQEEQIEYARSLRMLTAGWTPDLRREYFEWLLKAANYRGGASFEKFIEFIRADAVETLAEGEKSALAELLARRPERKSPIEALGVVFAGRKPHDWTLEELTESAKTGLEGRDFGRGRKMFAAAACFACHRFDNQGGMTGPDLTSAGRRYSPRDLLDQIVHPSKVVNEQFSAVTVRTEDGETHTGVVVNLNGDTFTLNTDLTDPNLRVTIDRKKVDSMKISETSPMPKGLLNLLTEEEVLDLVAYVISGGDPAHPVFQGR